MKRRVRAFTLVELLVVMAVIGVLLTLAVPRYFHSLDRSKEAVLKENLLLLRDALDKFYGDSGKYPNALEDLVEKKYLRKVPVDPITDSAASWLLDAPEDPEKGAVYNVRSGASGKSADGTPYAEW
jgi:general secretion pathway protein G